MRQLLLAIPLVFIVVVTNTFSAPIITPTALRLCPDTTWAACSTNSISDEDSTETVLIFAKSQDFFKCQDQCAKPRYDCEKSNNAKDKPGTKKNWEESGKCQLKYYDCLDKCE